MVVCDVLCDDVWFVVGVVFVCRLICLCVVPVEYCNAVWWVVLFCCVVVVCLCVFSFMCSWALFVNCCVVMYGLVLRVLWLLVSVPCV